VGIVRDEADMIETTVTRMLRQVDHVLVADNRSVDGTGEILRSLDRVTVVVDPDPNFADQQARKTTALAGLAAQRGADWVVPFDADEVWVADDGRIGDLLDDLPDHILLARAVMRNHVSTDRDPPGSDPPSRMVYRLPEFGRFGKVACRTRPDLSIVKGNHHASYGGDFEARRVDGLLSIHHFPIRSVEQFVAKARQRADELSLATIPKVYMAPNKRDSVRVLEDEGEDALVAKFYEEHWFADPDAAGLVLDPCP
jgi:glycosyltransferase involved in cell wall biosynthesis